jgi:hypothetical protein
MPKFKNRVGERYGRLLVTSHAGKDARNKHLWLCKCDCGNEKVVVSGNLSSGKSKSCGCLLSEFLKRKGNQYGLYENREHAILKVQYSHLKRRNNKIDSNAKCITFEKFYTLSKSKCHYCGLEHSKTLLDRTNETKGAKPLSDTIVCVNGIDRVDNSKGYVEDNVVPCCKYCNTAKNTMSRDEFFKWIKRVYEYNY